MPELPRNLPHLYLAGNGRAEPYTTRLRGRSRPLPQRDRAEHAEAVRFALAGAMAAAQAQRAERDPDVLTGTPGFYLDFEIPAGSEDAAERLENRRKHIELVAVRQESADSPATATVFVPDTATDHFLRKVGFTLGAEGSVAAGPVGRTATAQTDAQMHADILSWSRSQGLFAGLALEGATLRQDLDDNAALYGKKLQNRYIVTKGIHPPPAAAKLLALLNRYSFREHKD